MKIIFLFFVGFLEYTSLEAQSTIYMEGRNPKAFTEFWIRNKRQGAKDNSAMYLTQNSSSLHFIQPSSQIMVRFLKSKLADAGQDVKVKIGAILERKNGSLQPLNVSGYSLVTEKRDDKNDIGGFVNNIEAKYTVDFIEVSVADISDTEIDISALKLEEGDRIRAVVQNTFKDPKIGYNMIFEVDDYGWKNNATGGLTFLKTFASREIQFKPVTTIGWSFHYKPNKGDIIGAYLFSPSFGPEISVVDYEGNQTFGFGFQVSEFANSIKLGVGFLGNFPKTSSYWSIGFNFIDGVNTLKAIANRNTE